MAGGLEWEFGGREVEILGGGGGEGDWSVGR